MHTLTLLLLACVFLVAGVPAHAQGGEAVLSNPGFEGEYRPVVGTGDTTSGKARITGSVADGWQDNSNWADVAVDYGPETQNPHRGKAAQRVTISRVTGGAVQYAQGVQVGKGRVYRYSLWLRGRPGTTLTLLLRQTGAPYATYAETSASLAAEWQEFRVWGVCPEDARAFLMVVARAPMTFYVDDAAFEDLTEASTDAPRREGNLLNGGSFEAGLSFGWSARFREIPPPSDPRPRVDPATAAHGRQSYRLDVPAGATVEVRSPLFSYNYNRPHTLSLWLKASAPETGVYAVVEKTSVARSFRVGTEWARYEVSGTLPYLPFTHLRLQSGAPAGGQGVTLWMDGAQLEEAAQASPEYRAPFPHEMTLRLPRAGSIVFDGEKADAEVSVAPALPAGARLRLSVEDLYGTRRPLPDLKLPAAALTLPEFADRPRGVFKLRAEVVDAQGKPLSAPVELVWSRLPRPRDLDPQRSFFGIHIPFAPEYFALARASGMRRVRLHDSSTIGKWADAEPERDRFVFHDEAVTAAHDAGLAILGMLDGAPGWISTQKRTGYWAFWHLPDAPDALERWEKYVRTVVGHYRGRIDAWEVWNEPWGNWWSSVGGTPERYGELMRIAYRAAKEANPQATVVGIDTYPGRDAWTKPALAASGLESFDAMSFHDYNDALYGGAGDPALLHARELRDAQAVHGTPRPLWNTEGGPGQIGSFYAPETGAIAPRQQLAWAVRYDVAYLAAGVKAFFLYSIHTGGAMGDTAYRATEHDRAIRPILAARAVLASLVDGAGAPTRTEPVKGVDAYAFPPEKGQRVTVLWSHDGATHAVPVPAGTRALDVLGNPLRPTAGKLAVGPEPVYLVR